MDNPIRTPYQLWREARDALAAFGLAMGWETEPVPVSLVETALKTMHNLHAAIPVPKKIGRPKKVTETIPAESV